MTISELTNRLFGRVATKNNPTTKNGENEVVVFVSDESNNWNKFVLMVSVEAEKLPSERSSYFGTVRTSQKLRLPNLHSMTTAQWNELALRPQSHSLSENSVAQPGAQEGRCAIKPRSAP